MAKTIQIRHVPDDVHGTLTARAAEARMSLSGYLLREISILAGQPTMAEWLASVEADERFVLEGENEPARITRPPRRSGLIVLDASAVVDLLVREGPASEWVTRRLSPVWGQCHAPHLT